MWVQFLQEAPIIMNTCKLIYILTIINSQSSLIGVETIVVGKTTCFQCLKFVIDTSKYTDNFSNYKYKSYCIKNN